jgi:hypothetical protein
MSEHERCAGCGKIPVQTSGLEFYFVMCEVGCWLGPSEKTIDAAWSAWDRVMRAAREAGERQREDEYLASQQ